MTDFFHACFVNADFNLAYNFKTYQLIPVPLVLQSGRSKGYAFVEFESPVVAKIVVDTMNNYLMFNRLLKCKFIMT